LLLPCLMPLRSLLPFFSNSYRDWLACTGGRWTQQIV
jgi:hypothetical protein